MATKTTSKSGLKKKPANRTAKAKTNVVKKGPTKKKVTKRATKKSKTTTKKRTPKTTKRVLINRATARGVEREIDLPWDRTKVKVFVALQKLGALSSSEAQSTTIIAKKAGVSTRNTRHYCYHARAVGLVEITRIEGVKGYCFYLTTKGRKIDTKKELTKNK